MNVHFDGFSLDGLAFLDDNQAEQLKETSVEADDVLLNITGASIGRVCQVPSDFAGARVNQHVCIIRPVDGTLPAYLAKYLSSPDVQRMIWSEEYGVTRQALTKGQILAFTIPLPPLAEQKRIVAKVETLLAHVNAARQRLAKVPALLKRFRQSVLAAAIEDLPVASLGEVMTDLKYGTAIKCEIERHGTPVLRIPNVGNRVVDQTNLKYADLEPGEQRKLSLAPGDILLIRSNGSVSLIGKPALVSEKETGFAFAGYLMRLRLDCSRALPEYVTHVLESQSVREQIEMPARSTSGVHNINTTEVKALTIPLPPLAEQHEIVRRVEALLARVDRIEKRLATATRRVETLTQAILAQAFRGELVPTEAELARREGRDYEPAGVLLERIRATRAGTDSANKSRRSRRKPVSNSPARPTKRTRIRK
jgi:type I restriction enzyme S subunit